MPIDPQESREARSQIGQSVPAAGPVPPPEFKGSSTRGLPAIDPVQAEDLGQPFPFAPGGVVGTPIRPRHFSPSGRSARPISPLLLQKILDRKPIDLVERFVANDRAYREMERRAQGGKIGFGLIVFIAFVLAFLVATGGRF